MRYVRYAMVIAALSTLACIVLCPDADAQQTRIDYSSMLCQSKDDASCPVQCRIDLSYIYNDVKLLRGPLSAIGSNMNSTTLGMWFGSPMFAEGKHQIMIEQRVSGWILDAVKHHEACHEKMWRDTGSAKFHG